MIAIFPFRMLQQLTHRDLLVINYHSIKDIDPDPIINRNTYRTVEEFENDIVFLKENYQFVNIRDVLANNWASKYSGKKCVLITFDDGLRVVYDVFRPILLKHGVSATVFLNPCFVDNAALHYQRKKNLILHRVSNVEIEAKRARWKNIFSEQGIYCEGFHESVQAIDYSHSSILNDLARLFDVDFQQYLMDHPIYLSSGQIREMIKEGFGFGGHSMDHPKYDELHFDDQLSQTLDSIEWVCAKFDLDYRVFAFPLRDHLISVDLFEKIKEDCELSFGVRGIGDDIIDNHIQRMDVESKAMDIETVIKFEFVKYLLRCVIGKNKYKRN
ncbi:outer membrane N-deacetylase [Saccharicrinis fermentans DSM 9555 = JCM 21142]|uniref:Outer membrane N-deacetylase n=2 Tax=Saccharicrinis fermentans TaxID=982 RepID=W7Y6H1_9BACT|nr:outer membrane N-deacetylase [Saccharicrinis fermentans DSM 9555 = JCM 21142]